MSNFTASPSALHNRASQLNTLRQTDTETIRQLRILVMSLSESWKGEAQDAYVAKFLSMNTIFSQFDQMLAAYADLIDATATTAENADSTLLQAVQRIG